MDANERLKELTGMKSSLMKAFNYVAARYDKNNNAGPEIEAMARAADSIMKLQEKIEVQEEKMRQHYPSRG